MILFDTNANLELIRPEPDARVLAWVDGLDRRGAEITAICRALGAEVATWNTEDFENIGSDRPISINRSGKMHSTEKPMSLSSHLPRLHYGPLGTTIKDVWFFTTGDEVRSVFMQLDDPEDPDASPKFVTLGQAASDDLIAWRELPPALQVGRSGGYDDRRLHTGSVIAHDGVYYLYYSAKGSAQDGHSRIALATSTDGTRWTRHPENPIITPDERYYYGERSPIELRCHGWPIVDCRDFMVVADPEGNGWWGFYAARSPGSECAETSVIALCHSTDLVHWEQRPPCFAPERYACVEVPEVFELDGRWYMLCLTGNGYGQRYVMDDPNLMTGTIYAVADRVEGPYREPQGNVLVGSAGQIGFASRTVLHKGVRYHLYTHHSRISLPTVLATGENGRLEARWFEGLEAYLGPDAFDAKAVPWLPADARWGSIGTWRETTAGLTGRCRTDWALRVIDASEADFVFALDLRIDDARAAGMVFRIQGDDVLGGCYALILDADAREVVFTRPRRFTTIDRRRFAVERGRAYHLACVAHHDIVNLFIDEVLVLQSRDEEFREGRIGLFVERGSAEFSNLRVQTLLGTN